MTKNQISPKRVANQVINQEQIYVLDVRDKEAAEDWHIEGKNVDLINIPFEQLKKMDMAYLTNLPKDKPIYTVK